MTCRCHKTPNMCSSWTSWTIHLPSAFTQQHTNDDKRGQTSRPRPELRGRGQFLDIEAKAEAKNNTKKYQITTYDLRLLTDKLTKFPNFTRFLPQNARLHNNTTRSRPKLRGRSRERRHVFEAEAEANNLASRPPWPRELGRNLIAVLTRRCCKGDTSVQWRMAIFSPPPPPTSSSVSLRNPWTDDCDKKNTIDYLRQAISHFEINDRSKKDVAYTYIGEAITMRTVYLLIFHWLIYFLWSLCVSDRHIWWADVITHALRSQYRPSEWVSKSAYSYMRRRT